MPVEVIYHSARSMFSPVSLILDEAAQWVSPSEQSEKSDNWPVCESLGMMVNWSTAYALISVEN